MQYEIALACFPSLIETLRRDAMHLEQCEIIHGGVTIDPHDVASVIRLLKETAECMETVLLVH